MASNGIIKNLQITPHRCFYRPGDEVRLLGFIEANAKVAIEIELKIFRGTQFVASQNKLLNLQIGENEFTFLWQPGKENPAGYGVEITAKEQSGAGVLARCQTVFDVLADWTVFPRYGFLSDFSPARKNVDATIQKLNRFHINGLQFYDWLYRHDTLIPPQEDFLDPLGRPLSLKTTKELVTAAHQHGMAAMPYLAVYGASIAFWRAHPEWDLYNEKGAPIDFADGYLGIMNPTQGLGWDAHLLNECNKVLDQISFDGLHIDQYGDPKTGFSQSGEPVDMPRAFADFITAAAAQHPDVPVLINAVGNWPIETLAQTPVAFNYIEIWPPKISYTDVADIVSNARNLSGGKPVVIALYLPANRPVNNRLVDAMIFSAGGTRIELGENGRLLADPYFPKHEEIEEPFSETLRRQIELIIRYEEWISPLIEVSAAPLLHIPHGVMPFFRKTKAGYCLSLVNIDGKQELHWNEEHPAPEIKKAFTVDIELSEEMENVWLVSPDVESISPLALEFVKTSGIVSVQVPKLEIWDVLLFETKKQ